MPTLRDVDSQLELINDLVLSVCDIADARLRELRDERTRWAAMQRGEDSFRAVLDLCAVTQEFVKQARRDLKAARKLTLKHTHSKAE